MGILKEKRRHRKLRIAAIASACLLAMYVTSYIIFSRIALARCEAVGCSGLYFFVPEDSEAWQTKNYGCVCFYYPLIIIDEWIGTGKGIACPPLRRLGGKRKQKDSTNAQTPASSPYSPTPNL